MSIKQELKIANFQEFRSNVGKHGFSLNNFYDIYIEVNNSSPLYKELVDRSVVEPGKTVQGNIVNIMRLYCDEAALPGIQMTTGEYRINNTPQLKYAYGAVFSEASFSFILDADSIIKNVFDVWTNWIYSYSVDARSTFSNKFGDRFRTRYRDDYACDIVVIKYEKQSSSKRNAGTDTESFPLSHIIPATKGSLLGAGDTKFKQPVPVYAVRMFKAFPSNISSLALNSGTSELAKLSVSFEYESIATTPISGWNTFSGNVIDPVNGGRVNITDLDFFEQVEGFGQSIVDTVGDILSIPFNP